MTMSNFRDIYRKGLEDEAKVIAFLKEEFGNITSSNKEENIYMDIDCFMDGSPVSIKAEHAGKAYGNFYFEWANCLTGCFSWQDVRSNLNPETIHKLLKTPNWEPGWYLTGKAEWYAIYQGTRLYMFHKRCLYDYLATVGWSHFRPLSSKRKKTQGGNYRYCNTICGFTENKIPGMMVYEIG
jgi:hypothetical protein